MRISDIIYFAPDIRIDQIDFNDRESLISALSLRIKEYYFRPVELLLANGNPSNAFSVGVLVVTAMDAIAYYSVKEHIGNHSGSNRIAKLLIEINEFGFYSSDRDKIANTFTAKFRNGLIHEGRIKAGNQFSFCYGSVFEKDEEFLIINPRLLFECVRQYFSDYTENLRLNNFAFSQFQSRVKIQFESEIQKLIEVRSS